MAHSIARAVALLALTGPWLVAQVPALPPDHVYVNGQIWTGDTRRPSAEALAVAGDRIVAVGRNADVRTLAGRSTVIVDLGGRRVVPGFNDAHWHFPTRRSADLADAAMDEIDERVLAGVLKIRRRAVGLQNLV